MDSGRATKPSPRPGLPGIPYVPFGTQYYRAPSPRPGDWERDLRNIARLGFNLVKFWVQWRWNNPRPGEYYFDDIDKLLDLSARSGLKVMLNTIFDVAPAWIYLEYPDASMLTLDGVAVGPQTQPHRQIGGLGYCLNHEQVARHLFAFLRTTVERYREHPALEIWNVGSEPELTSSMAELREWSDDARRLGEALCTCRRCRDGFRAWLEDRYSDLEHLNRVWNRNYTAFREVELPRTRNTFNDVIDWRMYFVHVLGEHVRRRFEVAAEADQGRHPVMCHHVFIQGFPVTSTANDPWNVGRFGDLHGMTQMDDPMMIDVLRSCARDKPVISAEMLMLPGYTLDLPEPITENDIKRFIFSGLAGNLKGFIFWQYRPEILGREAPTWGLSRLDGGSTLRLEAFARVGSLLQKHSDFILQAQPPGAEVAILYNPVNQIFAWAATGSEKTATHSIMGMYAALYERNYRIDFLHPGEYTRALLESYRVILVPFPYVLGETLCRDLEWFVEQGGVLIGEANFAGWDVDRGSHAAVIPGSGLDRVFGVRQKDSHPVRGEQGIALQITSDHPALQGITAAAGALVRETYILQGARVLAVYDDGEPAVLQHTHGKGQACLLGSYVGLQNFRNPGGGSAGLICGLVEQAVEIARPVTVNHSRVRADLLSDGRHSLVILRNLEDRPLEDIIRFPLPLPAKLVEQFRKRPLKTAPDETGARLAVTLEPREVQVWYG